ncbi:MAG TPA: hypothetical protein VGH11_07565 [Jatrophihabitans sp.]
MSILLVLFIIGLAIAGLTGLGTDTRDSRYSLWPTSGRDAGIDGIDGIGSRH